MNISADDLRVGQYVYITSVNVDSPSFGMNPYDEYYQAKRVEKLTALTGVPLIVAGISLPFLAVMSPVSDDDYQYAIRGREKKERAFALDIRSVTLAKAKPGYWRQFWASTDEIDKLRTENAALKRYLEAMRK